MAHFYGNLKGNRGEATRCGTRQSGSRGLPMSAEPLASHPCNECGEPGTIYRLRDGRNYPSCDRCLRIDEVSDMLRGAVVWTAAAWAEAARVRAAAEKEKEEKRAVAEIVLEVLACKCGRGGISVQPSSTSGGTRITAHKCTGQWTVTASYRVDPDEVIRVIEEAREDAEKEKEKEESR